MDDGRSLSARADTLDVVISLRCTVLDVDHPEQALDVDVVARPADFPRRGRDPLTRN